ncbi:MAG: hypothetical protein M1497_04170, partial [Nitrospirae bacterium]|nr:hypothetical protein [Nitrospirota bacterium]
RSLVTPTYKVGLALAMIYTAKIFSLTQPVYQKDSGQAGMTSKKIGITTLSRIDPLKSRMRHNKV